MTPTEIRSFVARCRELAGKATPAEKLYLSRYQHGGGRLASPANWLNGDDGPRELVADFYDEGNREFYFASRTALPQACDMIEELLNKLEAK